MELNNFTSIKTAISQNQLSVKGLVSSYLEKIQSSDLNAFLETFDESAISAAELVDQKIAQGTQGRLAGMVIGIKDNICYANHKISASSKILGDFHSLYSATAVERLLAEDAVIIGRLNCDEFAMGSSNENSAFGPVLNPINKEFVPGGSSGGSAAAVKAGLCTATLGSDTGGSIRQPASFCGVVGLKPTYSRISRHGLIAYGSSFDQIGPITNDVSDSALLLEIMAGKDTYDSTSSQKTVEKYSDLTFSGKARIAVYKECLYNEGLDPEIRDGILKICEKLKSEGHEVVEVPFDKLKFLVPAYYVLTTAEASSNLGRYDGMRYGFRSPDGRGVENTIRLSRSQGFGKEVKRRIMLGTFVLSAGFYDAYYRKAMKVRQLIRQEAVSQLTDYDFILTPSTPGTSFKFGQKGSDPIKMYLEDIFTVQANITGMPAISIPAGTHSNGMPYGLQLMAADFKEKELLNFSNYVMNKLL